MVYSEDLLEGLDLEGVHDVQHDGLPFSLTNKAEAPILLPSESEFYQFTEE